MSYGVVLPYHSIHEGWTYIIHMAARYLLERVGIRQGRVQGRTLLQRTLELHPNDFAALLRETGHAGSIEQIEFVDVYAGATYVRVRRWV